MVIGHATILAFFDRAMREGALAQAYCFVGPDKIGKRTVANHIAAQLLRKSDGNCASSPDYAYFEREIDAKTGKRKKDLTIAQAREIRSRLERRSWLGGYQVVVVDDVSYLNEEAANALLKTLEEPAEKSVIFLLAENDQALLPTIRSRCQMIHFSLVSDRVLRSGLEAMSADPSFLSESVRVAQGIPGKAYDFAFHESVRAEYYAERERFMSMLTATVSGKFKLLENVMEEKDGEGSSRERVDTVLTMWLAFAREMLLHGESRSLKADQILVFIDAIQKGRKQLRMNGNVRLVVESILLSL